MKFRYKVLIINIILLSIGIGTIGFLMIDKNFQLALDSQIKTAVEENNLIQSTVEYELLGYTNQTSTNITNQLAAIGDKLTSEMYVNDTSIYLIYGGFVAYTNSTTSCPDSLINYEEIGTKKYVLVEEANDVYIYTASSNELKNKKLNIVNKRKITSIYQLMNKQKAYFNILLVITLVVCSIFMYIISILLTRPLEKLAKVSESFGSGDYKARANLKSKDEVGNLAHTYNNMASAVENHIIELNNMVTRQDQFVADFTHEIKTPMTSIIGYADTIRSIELNREDQIMAASYIFNEGKRLEAMSMKLFEFIYTKQNKIVPQTIDVRSLMHSVSESTLPALHNSDIKLVTTTDSYTISGDKDLLSSAFINLIDNARKASKSGSTIYFSGAKTDNGFSISVKDEGIGISEEHLEKICDEFYMVDKSRSRKEGGAGLGLSLAALIFKSHEADFKIESTLNIGTTITITFPEIKKEVSDEK